MRRVRTAGTDRRRTSPAIIAIVLMLAGGVLYARHPDAPQHAAISAIHAYKAHLSPLFARAGVRCRFQPTCSRYTELAIQKYGLVKGSMMGAWRILRCGPWTPLGTVDVP